MDEVTTGILKVLDDLTELDELKKQELATAISKVFGIEAQSYFVAHPMGDDWEQLSVALPLAMAAKFHREVNHKKYPYPRILAELVVPIRNPNTETTNQ